MNNDIPRRKGDLPEPGGSPPSDATGELSALTDEWLAVRCLLGEPEAFDALVDRFHEPLWDYVRRLLPDEHGAADALQDAWLRIFRGLPRLRDPVRLRSWLFGIARRTVMDHLRQRYAQRVDDTADLSAVTDETSRTDARVFSEAEEAERVTVRALLHGSLHAMPVIDRDVLVLFYLQDLSLAQIADVQDVPVGTVKSRLSRARSTLRRLMSPPENLP